MSDAKFVQIATAVVPHQSVRAGEIEDHYALDENGGVWWFDWAKGSWVSFATPGRDRL